MDAETKQAQAELDRTRKLADAISRSLLFSLERGYLDVAFEDATYLQLRDAGREPRAVKTHFLRIDQVGMPLGAATDHAFTAFQTALAACHDPTRYTLLFIVKSDGYYNALYLGVRANDEASDPSAFTEYLGGFLRGNWPGTRLTPCDLAADFKAHELHYAAALTGIPSLRPGDNPGSSQSLERMLRGMRGKSFYYLVIARPTSETVVNTIINRCRDLLGYVHTLTRFSQSDTQTGGGSYSERHSRTEQVADSDQTSIRSGSSRDRGIDIQALITGLTLFFPPADLLTKFATIGGMALAANFNQPEQSSNTKGNTHTVTHGQSYATTSGVNWSVAQALSKEYINAHAQAAEKTLQQYIARFEQARSLGCWNVGVYMLSDDEAAVTQGGTQLRALLSGGNSVFEPIRVHDLSRIWHVGAPGSTSAAHIALRHFKQPLICLVDPANGKGIDHPLGSAFNDLTTPLNTEELALLVNLPRREVPGVRVMPTAEFTLNPPLVPAHAIHLGTLLEGGEPTSLTYRIGCDALTKHVLITGTSGSGTSTTGKQLLNSLYDNAIPFLVIEPSNDEYLEWAITHNVPVYAPGAKLQAGQVHDLHLNPLEVVWLADPHRPNVLAHIDRLTSVLNATLPLYESMPLLLENALCDIYQQTNNWITDDCLPPRATAFPTMSQLLTHIPRMVKEKGYEPWVAANVTAALVTRVENLLRGWKKQLFDQHTSTPWADLFDRPAVINLSYVSDDADKAFIMALLFQFMFEYRQARAELADPQAHRTPQLHHVTLIEEAQRILARPTLGTPESVNPQGKLAGMFANLFTEFRTYGEGLILVDQVPTKLIPDAVKHTNVKIVHRLINAHDRDAMSTAMSLTAEQALIISRLRTGQAIVCSDQADMAAWVQICQQ